MEPSLQGEVLKGREIKHVTIGEEPVGDSSGSEVVQNLLGRPLLGEGS